MEVIYYVAASIDGFIATRDGGVDWLSPFEGGDEDYGYREFYDSIDAVVMGRKTFEQAIGFAEWSFQGKPVVVLGHADHETVPENVSISSDAPTAVLSDLQHAGHRRAWLVGGGTVAGAFVRLGLVTELIVSVIPVILGDGIGLFGGETRTTGAQLLACRSYDSGIVQARYRLA